MLITLGFNVGINPVRGAALKVTKQFSEKFIILARMSAGDIPMAAGFSRCRVVHSPGRDMYISGIEKHARFTRDGDGGLGSWGGLLVDGGSEI